MILAPWGDVPQGEIMDGGGSQDRVVWGMGGEGGAAFRSSWRALGARPHLAALTWMPLLISSCVFALTPPARPLASALSTALTLHLLFLFAPPLVVSDTFISKTKRLYADSHTQRNLARMGEDLAEVHQIMTRNIAEVLGQGERLAAMSKASGELSAESKKYAGRAKELARQALIKKFGPAAVVIVIVLLALFMRYKYFQGLAPMGRKKLF